MLLSPPGRAAEQEHFAEIGPVENRSQQDEGGPAHHRDRGPSPCLAAGKGASQAGDPERDHYLAGDIHLGALAAASLPERARGFGAHGVVENKRRDQEKKRAEYYRYVLQPHGSAPVSFDS